MDLFGKAKLFLMVLVVATFATVLIAKIGLYLPDVNLKLNTNTDLVIEVNGNDVIGMLQNETNVSLSKLGEKYLLDNEYCLILNIDTSSRKVSNVGTIQCTGKPSITFVDGSYVRLNWTRIRNEYGGDLKHCQYMPVIRGSTTFKPDFQFQYGNVSKKFNIDIRVPPEHEYLRIHCYNKSERIIYTNFHAAVTPKKTVEKRCDELFGKHMEENQPNETYNVIFLGMDSVSRLNFAQNMPRTREFLLNDLVAFEMKGYTKIADNTFPNVFAMTTGNFIHEIGEKNYMNQYFDRYNFFWKNFSQAGYRTMYSEDAPGIAIFTYLRKGFQNPPADYYNRHLQLALQNEKAIWNSDHQCIGDKMVSRSLLDYTTEYSRVFKDKPHFAFVFITGLTHSGNLDYLAAAEEPYLEFFRSFKQDGRLDNTLIVFFGDHGVRFGESRNTYRGKIQDRMPMMYLIFPQSFHVKYPHLAQNLRTNSRRLTTPLDIFETVKDIIKFDGLDRNANVGDRGISLFRDIPKERTCDHAGINPHWCVCLGEKKMNTTTPFAVAVGRRLIDILNRILAPEKAKCSKLALGEVTGIVEKKSTGRIKIIMSPEEKLEQKTNSPTLYQITVYALPSNALFEATLFYDKQENKYQLFGDIISRLNMYGNQSSCVSNPKLLQVPNNCTVCIEGGPNSSVDRMLDCHEIGQGSRPCRDKNSPQFYRSPCGPGSDWAAGPTEMNV